ncbi:MAG: UDP-2,4-diacetamido-2,4,6-trideoxy-beta-L-altropyranose hydrolase [Candidatus Omnitrophica bacterium]|nr:UDP-2,4-diacetamido-2,4,6-trideoxy-beta-L-altropyranose hydrolase [Candidatus Omnitrophota bacterium]
MKVSILTEAGKNIGFGHLTRCIALYQAFEQKNYAPELIINGDESILGFVKDKKYRIMDWIKEQEKLNKIAENSDVVVIDSYLAPKSLYDNISSILCSQPKPFLMIDDYNRINYPKGVVVNPSIYGDKLDYPKREGMKYLLGKDYIILRKPFLDIPKKEINKDVKDVLVTLGGMDNADFLTQLLEFLAKEFPDFTYHVVTNFNFNLPPKADPPLAGNLNLYSGLSAQEILEVMLKADICISGGGQTTYELARVGVPTIGICFAENQTGNLKYGDLCGYLKYIGNSGDNNLLDNIKDALEEITSFEQRDEMSNLGRVNVDGKGAGRIVIKGIMAKREKENK